MITSAALVYPDGFKEQIELQQLTERLDFGGERKIMIVFNKPITLLAGEALEVTLSNKPGDAQIFFDEHVV